MLRLLRPTSSLRTCRRFLHFFKSSELDEPDYFKTPLDPRALSLLKKYNDDILYSSHSEVNKKPLSYEQRMYVLNKINKRIYQEQLKLATAREPSIILDKASEFSELIPNNERTPAIVESQTGPFVMKDFEEPENSEDKAILARAKLKLFTEMGLRRSALEHEMHSFPDNWMEDYETFDETEFTDLQYGTPDPKVPITKVPCHGCGSLLQCADASVPGYLPSELIRGREKSVLMRLICQRCHFLKNYNTALKVQVNPEDYVNMISKIKDETALAILMVDLVDFPCSLWPNIIDIIGEERPVIIVGNKVDLLPQDSSQYLKHITSCLESHFVDAGMARANLKGTFLVSAQTNYGIEDLISALYKVWANKGDVYLIGNANVGKSTLFNALLRSDYCKMRARNLVKRATSSAWPGTTLRMLKFPIARPSSAFLYEREKRLRGVQREKQQLERLKRDQVNSGRAPEKTLMEHLDVTFEYLPESKFETEVQLTDAAPVEKYFNENTKAFKSGKWLYDTPGVIQNDQTINLLTSEELLYMIPKQTLWPRSFYVLPGQTLFLAGLGRIDYIGGASSLRLSVYASEKLSILIVNTEKADEIYQASLGSELINVPRGDEKRIQDWPPLVRMEDKISIGNYYDKDKVSICDIVLSSAGWASVNVPPTETANFYVWTPEGRGMFVRKPSLLPYAADLYRGKRKSFTPAYSQIEPKKVTH